MSNVDYVFVIKSLSLASFYLHFTLQPTYADRLCFQWDFGDGKGLVCFMAVVMIFGIPHAPWVVTMVTDVLVKFFRQSYQIYLNPFIDDFSVSDKECECVGILHIFVSACVS